MKGIAIILAATVGLVTGCSQKDERPVVQPVVYQPTVSRPALTEPQILAMLDSIHQSEIQEAQLAQQRAANPQVRDYANRMQNDHTMLNQHGNNLSSRLNLQPAQVFNKPDHRLAMDAMRMKSGTEFDRAYIQHNIMEHQDALRTLNDIARDARTPDIQTLVAQARPVIEMHLRTAQELDRQLAMVPPPLPPATGAVVPVVP